MSDCCLAVPINPPCVWNIIQSVQLHFTPLASYLPAVVVVLYEKPALDYPTPVPPTCSASVKAFNWPVISSLTPGVDSHQAAITLPLMRISARTSPRSATRRPVVRRSRVGSSGACWEVQRLGVSGGGISCCLVKKRGGSLTRCRRITWRSGLKTLLSW